MSAPGREAGVDMTPPPARPPPEPPARKNDPDARKDRRREAIAHSRRLGV
jgi:hypothetical protein